jgi:hypothetical protein
MTNSARDQGEMFPDIIPITRHTHARRGDPATSHAAARSIEGKLTISQQEVLNLFRTYERLTDKELVYVASQSGVRQSPSGLRTRRRELADALFVVNSGHKILLPTGRRAIEWVITDRGREHDVDE